MKANSLMVAMNRVSASTILCLFPFFLMAQIDSTETKFRASLSIKGVLDLSTTAENLFVVDTRVDSLSAMELNVDSCNARITGGELVIDYFIKDPDKAARLERNGYREQVDRAYHTDLTLYLGDDELFIRPDKILGDYGRYVRDGHGKRTIIVTGFSDKVIKSDDTLSINVDLTVSCRIPDPYCDRGEPKFGMPQKAPFLAAAVGGTGLIVGGIVLRVQALDKYEEYEAQLDRALGNNLYESAKSKNTAAWILIGSGTAVLIGDAIWYFSRKKKYQKSAHLFKFYCDENGTMSLNPTFRLPSEINPNGTIGLSISYQFK